MDIQTRLLELAKTGNQKFTQSLHPGITNILGLRVPDVRKLAQEIVRGDWRAVLSQLTHKYMEENMLHGMIIGLAGQVSLEERMRLMADFIPYINSWSVCDTFCSTLKFTENHRDEMWRFVLPYFASADEYAVRFAVVMGMDYYINAQYLPRLFKQLDGVTHNGYYVKMGIAWAVSVCYVHFPTETEIFLGHNSLDPFTQNKIIQKIRESYRVDAESKARLLVYKKDKEWSDCRC